MDKAKPFERWKYEEVQLTFGIQRAQTLPALTDWLNTDGVADDYETRTIKRYYSELVRKVDAWNEDELKFFFLANLITLVNFAKPSVYSSFPQRTISAERLDVRQNKVELRGRVEFLRFIPHFQDSGICGIIRAGYQTFEQRTGPQAHPRSAGHRRLHDCRDARSLAGAH